MVNLGVNLQSPFIRTPSGAYSQTRSAKVTETVAVNQFRAGKVTVRQLGDLLGLTYPQTVRFLAEQKLDAKVSIADRQAADASSSIDLIA